MVRVLAVACRRKVWLSRLQDFTTFGMLLRAKAWRCALETDAEGHEQEHGGPY